MKRPASTLSFALILVVGLSGRSIGQEYALDTTDGLTPHNVVAEATVFDDKPAVYVTEAPDAGAHTLLLVEGLEMTDGTIELDIAGLPGLDWRI